MNNNNNFNKSIKLKNTSFKSSIVLDEMNKYFKFRVILVGIFSNVVISFPFKFNDLKIENYY